MGESKITAAAEAAAEIVKAVPVYQDAIQPAAKEIGTALLTVAKAINAALAPVSVLVWGYDQIKDFVSTTVAEKLKNVPPENITSPKPNVAGPALEALKYTGHEEMLRDMYANLLAASMDARTAAGAHPCFTDIIRQLTPDEARILRLFALPGRTLPLITVRSELKGDPPVGQARGGVDVLVNFSLLGHEANCQFPHLTASYIGNICRLGLAEIPSDKHYTADSAYVPLENHPQVIALLRSIEASPGFRPAMNRSLVQVTELGKLFCKVCIIPHDQEQVPSVQ